MQSIITICGREIKFSNINQQEFQEKFDLFFMTLKLLGHSIYVYDSAKINDRNHFQYNVSCSKDYKGLNIFRIAFEIYDRAVIGVTIMVNGRITKIDKQNMPILLEILDELLIYV